MSSEISLSLKDQHSKICTWRNIIEYLSEKDRKILTRVCQALRIMVLHDPAADLEKMRERRTIWVVPPKSLTESIGLSELFFNSFKEPLSDIQQLISKDPNVDKVMRDIFAKEKAHLQYIPAYHAMNMETFITMLFIGIIHSCIPHSSPITSFIRFPSLKGPKTIEELFKMYPPNQYTGYDWAEPVRKELLSCNPHLFSNINWRGESAFLFFQRGANISPPPIKELLQELSLNYHLSLGDAEIDQLIACQKVLFDLVKNFNQLNLKKENRDPEINRGVMWQFLIPPAVLDRVAYASLPMGEKYPSHSGLSLSQRCLALKKDPSKEPDMQIRLLAQAMFVKEHDIHVFVHGCDFFSSKEPTKPKDINDEDWHLQQQYLDKKNQFLFYIKYFFTQKLLAIPKSRTNSL